MPKIIINEIDATTPGSRAYANFAVLVPGFVNAETAEEAKKVFDDNDIYECSSKADFETYIGKVSPKIYIRQVTKAAVAAEATHLGTVVDGTEISDTLYPALADACTSGTLYRGTANENGEIGYLKDADREYIQVDESVGYISGSTEVETDNLDGDATTGETGIVNHGDKFNFQPGEYYRIEKEKRGVDAVTTDVEYMHLGNQIAHELLSMGYTVLYKKLDDSLKATTATDTELGNPDTIEKPGFYATLAGSTFWEPLQDKATYDFRYIIHGLVEHTADANKAIADLAAQRGDCIALMEIDRLTYADSSKKGQKEILNAMAENADCGDKYAAYFAPTVTYGLTEDVDFGNNTTFPGSFHYLACAARNAANYSEWYANAGYTRGISNFTIVRTGYKFGEAAIQALEPRYSGSTSKAINLIVKIKSDYLLWGNRTAETLDQVGLRASHFLNIRQLCSTIKKQVYVACRRFTFDPNSDVLWINFCNAIRPTLEKMKADQGINGYKIIKTNTHGQKGLLSAAIRIVPIEAVEDFIIDLYLEDSIAGINMKIEEI